MENPLNLDNNNLDSALRPNKWGEYVGQEKIKRNLQILIRAAKERKETPEHLLFYGSSGLGKTSLAYLVAKEMDSNIKITSGPAIEKPGDLAAILSNLSEGDILFIDEFHRLNKVCEEVIYPVMEDFKLNMVIGKGPMARTMSLDIPPFTLIGATTKMALLSSPVRNRFGGIFQLNFYREEEIEKIIERSAKILNVQIKPEAIKIIARRSRFTPRVANRILKRTRDFAQIERKGIVDKEASEKALEFLEVDNMGLEVGDKKIIKTIIEKFNGGPVGLQSLAAASSEEENTILDIYEPYLMQIGFIERTSRGRMATKSAYEHLGIKYKGDQKLL